MVLDAVGAQNTSSCFFKAFLRDFSAGSVGSNVPHCAASIAFGAICITFVVTVPGSFVYKN